MKYWFRVGLVLAAVLVFAAGCAYLAALRRAAQPPAPAQVAKKCPKCGTMVNPGADGKYKCPKCGYVLP